MEGGLGFVVWGGQFYREGCAFAFFALEGDFAVLGFDEAFYDGQPEALSFGFGCEEGLEEFGFDFVWDACARVCYGDDCVLVLA